MSEHTSTFGEHQHLMGTITRTAGSADIGCILLCAGVIHRIGPHRFNVKLARALARAGHPALRLDLAAVGDSRSPPTETAYDEQAVVDIRAAIDHLIAQTGVTRVVLIGLCSGAVYSLRTALRDERVTGIHMIDGYAYATARTRRERYLQRARTITPAVIGKSLRSRLMRDKTANASPPGGQAAPDYGLAHPPQAEVAADLERLLKRGVSIYQMFSGSILQHYNYAEQFAEGFAQWPALAAVRTEYTPHIDHTATALSAQQELIDKIVPWVVAIDGN